MLRTIGALIESRYYKDLPLQVFKGGLRIIINLNPMAFSVG